MKRLISTIILIQLTFLNADNYSLSFDGVDDRVEIPSINLASEFTISTWVKVNSSMSSFGDIISVGTYGGAISVYTDLNENSEFPFPYMKYNLNQSNSSNGWYDGINVSIEFDRWYYVVGTYKDDTAKMYLDGQLIGQENMPDVNINYPIWLADRNFSSSYSYNLDGFMDEVGIWDEELSQEEIQSYMSTPPTESESGLVGYWNFNEGTGTTLTDLSGNGNDGTIVGATWDEDGSPVDPPPPDDDNYSSALMGWMIM